MRYNCDKEEVLSKFKSFCNFEYTWIVNSKNNRNGARLLFDGIEYMWSKLIKEKYYETETDYLE